MKRRARRKKINKLIRETNTLGEDIKRTEEAILKHRKELDELGERIKIAKEKIENMKKR